MVSNYDLRAWFFKLIYKVKIKLYIYCINYVVHLICAIKGLERGKNVKFLGFPKIYREPYSKIRVGNNCRFNSAKRSVQMGLLKPCTFLTLTRNAEIIFGDCSGASGVTIAAADKIQIGNNVIIGANCNIIDNDFHNTNPSRRVENDFAARPIIIEDDVFIGFNCFILKGVTIGRNSVIGANSVVISNIPSDSIAMGNPCKVVLKRNW